MANEKRSEVESVWWGWLSGAFGLAVYGYFFWVFLYAMFFIGSLNENFGHLIPTSVKLWFPNSMDASHNRESLEWTPKLLLRNSAFLGLFALQHAIMARGFFKKFVTKYVYSSTVERSMFVLAASSLLHGMYITWTPLTAVVWKVPVQFQPVMWATYFFGWVIVLLSTFMIDHFDLFGVTRAFGFKPSFESETFVANYFYAYVRHPIMSGFLIAFWATPIMTQGRLLFAMLTTAFIIHDVYLLEERDLKNSLTEYQRYCDHVGAFCPMSFSGYQIKAS